MTNIYFIRHAESDLSIKNEEKRPLTVAGKQAAELLSKRLTGIEFHAFYSSPYLRSINTISPLAKKHSKQVIIKDGFRERKIGRWIDDFKSFAEKQWKDFSYKIDNEESLLEVQQRNIKLVEEVVKFHRNQNAVIGTHGTALSTILNYYNPKYGFEDFWEIAFKNPFIVKMTFSEETYIEYVYIDLE